MSGCVNYSRRFYDETLKEPATASPLVFPETVFNAPASHLAALLGTAAINYTLVGDPGTFLQAIALAADWLLNGRVDACLVVGSEEMDWLTAEAFHLFDRSVVLGEGAGALYLLREPHQDPPIRLRDITQSQLFSNQQTRAQAAKRVRAALGPPDKAELLCDGLQGSSRIDRAEAAAWFEWPGPRLSPKTVLGEGMMAAAAWQCVAAVEAIRRGESSAATVSVVGSNEQAIAARFIRNT
jgi:3-oxoacyl-(acyl-carrier-protein) synthase